MNIFDFVDSGVRLFNPTIGRKLIFGANIGQVGGQVWQRKTKMD